MSDKLSSAEIADLLLNERRLLSIARHLGTKESWDQVLNTDTFWSLRHHNDEYSVVNMSYHELQQSILEDLLFVEVEKLRGSAAIYPNGQSLRHLRDRNDQIDRINVSINSVIHRGYVLFDSAGFLSLNMNRLRDIEEFCGVYLFEWSLKEDLIDSLLKVGGKALLEDTLDDFVNDMNNNPLTLPDKKRV